MASDDEKSDGLSPGEDQKKLLEMAEAWRDFGTMFMPERVVADDGAGLSNLYGTLPRRDCKSKWQLVDNSVSQPVMNSNGKVL
jgi:hypothetical protein